MDKKQKIEDNAARWVGSGFIFDPRNFAFNFCYGIILEKPARS